MAKKKRTGLHQRRRLLPWAERVEERILLAPFVVTNTSDTGSGSLRQAILDADATPGPNTITFAITTGSAPYVINVQSPLPHITVPVVLNGTSQPGYAGTPIIEIDGGGHVGDGLLLAAGSDGSTIEGLDIANFPDRSGTDGAGIHILSNGNLIQSNYLGTDLTGKAAGPGNFFGVFIDGASNNTIGGAGSLGNLISGNSFDGVLIYDNPQPAQHNLVIGNQIGTDVSGTAALPNTGSGIDLWASNNSIGGTSAASRNVVSANHGAGIKLAKMNTVPSKNLIQGNYIGTDLTGTIALGNGSGGVSDNNGLNNTIGGTTAGAGNLISGNQGLAGIILTNDLGR